MEINQIRLFNLSYVIDREYNGVKAGLASAINKNSSYVSRWYSASSERRNISTETARDIEQKINYAKGWLDNPHPALWDMSTQEMWKLELSEGDAPENELIRSLAVESNISQDDVRGILSGAISDNDSRTDEFFITLKSRLQLRYIHQPSNEQAIYPPRALKHIDRFLALTEGKQDKLDEFLSFLESSK